jgi:BirA family biotin operon repressor/biotin-[acetyl-CoA-carboxylase] ligase
MEVLSQALTVSGLKSFLGTEFMGKEICLFQSVFSTQDEARKLVQQGAREGTVVLAETQTGGRGRMGRDWFSPPGRGLWTSIILYPRLSSSTNVISLTCALAIANAIRAVSGLKALVKWPNDVVIGGRKTAGVLVEISGKAAIVGTGINVNVDEEDFPPAFKQSATSLLRELGREISRVSLMREFLHQFERYYRELGGEGFVCVMNELKSISAVLGRQVVVSFNGKRFAGEAIDIDTDGALVIRLDSGVQRHVLTGNVSF